MNDCFYRMPCGICRLTNKMCPLGAGNTNPASPICYDIDYLHKETITTATSLNIGKEVEE